MTAAVADPGPVPDPAAERTAREQLDELARFGEATDAPLSLALPPSLDDELTADAELQAGVGEAVDTGELLALPYLTLDPSSAVAAGRIDAFSREVRRGEDALAEALPGASVRRSAWLVLEPLSRPAAAALRDPSATACSCSTSRPTTRCPEHQHVPRLLPRRRHRPRRRHDDAGRRRRPPRRAARRGAVDARTPTERAVEIVGTCSSTARSSAPTSAATSSSPPTASRSPTATRSPRSTGWRRNHPISGCARCRSWSAPPTPCSSATNL